MQRQMRIRALSFSRCVSLQLNKATLLAPSVSCGHYLPHPARGHARSGRLPTCIHRKSSSPPARPDPDATTKPGCTLPSCGCKLPRDASTARIARPRPHASTEDPLSAQANQAPAATFHRKPLPCSCVPFSSPKGRRIFQQAMLEGGLASYYVLAENFQTQSEPAFCGLGTLSMSLNTLGVDPGRKWKGPWRWFDDRMVECCVPLHKFEKEGMSFDEFGSLARCNGATVTEMRATDTDLASFRKVLEDLTLESHMASSDNHNEGDDDRFISKSGSLGLERVLVVSYNRAVIGQTGEGHFSPIAAYSPSRDMVLILDVARFKYPPHWVPVPLLWEAMSAINAWNNKSRGYFVLARPPPPEVDEQCPVKIRTWAVEEKIFA